MAVISFKCPNCDGELIFDPETQKYKCEYCGSKFTQAELDALQPAESEETDAGAADGSDEAEQELSLIHIQMCIRDRSGAASGIEQRGRVSEYGRVYRRDPEV